MKYAFALPGSRGDIQPALSVASELRRRGHDIEVGVSPDLVEWATRLGFAAQPIGLATNALFDSEPFRLHMSAANPVTRYRALQDVACYGWDELTADMADLAAGADTIVTGLLAQELGSSIAERDGAGFAALHYCPIRANDAVPLIPGVRVGAVQKAAWKAGEAFRWGLTKRSENAQRRALGLAPAVVDTPQRLRDRGALEIQAYEGTLFPGLARSLGAHRPFTGFLNLSADDRALLGEAGLDDELSAWLDAGDPPVYVGFGSLASPVDDPAALLDAVAGASAELGVRVLISGWRNGDEAVPEHVKIIGAADHTLLFPRCAAAVHHGGAGTVGASLRAGIPTVVAWVSSDQPMWGAALRRAGLGVSIKAASLDRARVRAVLEQVLRPEVRAAAARMRETMVQPDAAVAATADLLEQAR